MRLVEVNVYPHEDDGPPRKGRLFIDQQGLVQQLDLVAMEQVGHPIAGYRKLLPEIFEVAGVVATAARWDKHAGCSTCPCSPGFVLEDVRGQNIRAVVEIEDEEIRTLISAASYEAAIARRAAAR